MGRVPNQSHQTSRTDSVALFMIDISLFYATSSPQHGPPARQRFALGFLDGRADPNTIFKPHMFM